MAKIVAILCGPRESYGFCPVPPMANSAPERNVFRLAEFDYGADLQVHVVSACSPRQRARMEEKAYLGHYHHLVFPEWLLALSGSRLLRNKVTERVCCKLCRTPDLFTWLYVSRACRRTRQIAPDLILINSLPQYLRLVRLHFPRTPLGLFVRGEMSSSRRYLALADLIVTNSAGIARYVEGLLARAPVPVRVMPNSLGPSYCTSEKRYANANSRRVVYVGRIARVKGLLELLHAYRIVEHTVPGAALTIVGGNYGHGPLSEFEQELLDYAVANALSVHFAGRVPNGDTPDILQQADVAVFPSVCLESFGMVALEAMRCGLPVVASRRPGFEELIVDGETGILVDDPEDIGALAGAIVQLLRRPEMAERMGRAGRARSLQFVPERANERFRQIVLDALSQERPRDR